MLYIYNVYCVSSIIGDYNKICIGKMLYLARLNLIMVHNYNNSELEIEDSMYLGSCDFRIEGDNRKIHVGKNCLFSDKIYITTTDHHPMYDLKTNKWININQDVVINNNVWIGLEVVFKGSVIPSGCVIGAKSIVNKSFTKENCVIAGIPVKVVEEDVY